MGVKGSDTTAELQYLRIDRAVASDNIGKEGLKNTSIFLHPSKSTDELSHEVTSPAYQFRVPFCPFANSLKIFAMLPQTIFGFLAGYAKKLSN